MGIAPEAKAALATAYGTEEAPRLVTVMAAGRDELWALGETVFVLPAVPPDAPPELEYALRLRREASLTGRCDGCNAAAGISVIGKFRDMPMTQMNIPHRRNCPAHDHNAGPMLDAYYETRQADSPNAFADAAKRTKEKIEERIPNRLQVPSTQTSQQWIDSLIDDLLKTADRCGHLSAMPAQTWNILLGHGQFRCDECWEYLRSSASRGEFKLSLAEEFTCDFCRRYVTSMVPLVARVSNFVLRGGLCRRCAKTLADADKNEDAHG